jgi:hypothetical protein
MDEARAPVILQLHLPSPSLEVRENPPEDPSAYNEAQSFTSQPQILGDEPGAASEPCMATATQTLADFRRSWPVHTTVACHWCCQPFDNVPFGMPVHFDGTTFHVTGCFCSLECATAFNFGSTESTLDKWAVYTAINAYAHTVGYSTCVQPAPPRLALDVFGGHLSIEQFRQGCGSSRHFVKNQAPVTLLPLQIEEVCYRISSTGEDALSARSGGRPA